MERIVLRAYPPFPCRAIRMQQHPRAIFLFSLEPWGDMWYSKHHYAAFLAKRFPVYFISLPDRWRWTDLFSWRARVHTVKEGVHVVDYRNNLPLRLLPAWLARWVNRINAWKLRRLMPSPDVLFWCFHPAAVMESRILRRPGSKLVYHVVDPYQSLPNDSSFARTSDLVAAINPWYVDYYSRLNGNCLLVPHGVRSEDRAWKPAEVAKYTDQWGTYAVMAAGINYRTNYALLIAVARRYPKLRLVIVGQLFGLEPGQQLLRERLFAQPNVTYIGVKHPDILRDIIRGARMGLVTYDFEPTRSVPITGVGTPLKVITYLAQGCPVVSTLNSYVPVLDGKGNFKAENDAHFVDLVGDVLDGKKAVDQDVVEAYLDSVDYSRLTQRILERLTPVSVGARGTKSPIEADNRPVIPPDSPVVVISNEEWNGPRYSKHRYAIALRDYRKVYFIDPAQPWRPIHLFRWRISSTSTPEGVTVLSYYNAIPLFGGLFGSINDQVITHRLRRYFRHHGIPRPLFWSFDPSRLLRPGQLGAIRAVYHCADDHTFRWKEEQVLAEHCDHVFCIARDLMPRFWPLNRSVHFVPHGIAASDTTTGTEPTNAPTLKPGYGLYIGNINDRHDFALWDRLFAANPTLQFLVVGPVNVTNPTGRDLLERHRHTNVHYLPPVPYEQLPALIAASGFGFLYLRGDHPANRISSQKVVQFLAQGKPFFCSWLAEYADKREAVHMTDDPQDALDTFHNWREGGDPPGARAARLALAQEQLFTTLLDRLPFRL